MFILIIMIDNTHILPKNIVHYYYNIYYYHYYYFFGGIASAAPSPTYMG